MESVSSFFFSVTSILKKTTETSNREIAMKCHKKLLLTQKTTHPGESIFLRSVIAIRYPDNDMLPISPDMR